MKAHLLEAVQPGWPDKPDRPDGPLRLADVPDPEPGAGELLVRVTACGVCHTELDEIAGRTEPRLPIIPGHQVVGRVEASSTDPSGSGRYRPGERVGVAWIRSACGRCAYCGWGEENLCPDFVATGRDADGGYAERITVPEPFAHAIPDALSDEEAAPLLCAGAIGWRSLRLTGLVSRGGPGGLGRGGVEGRLGLTGFGASGHLVLKLVAARFPEIEVSVFARDERQRAFAAELGAAWAGDTEDEPPTPLDAVIDTTPAWRPPLAALRHLRPGGRLVINAIRKTGPDGADREALAGLDYTRDLWMEREIKSVANVARRDVREVLDLAAECGVRPEIRAHPFERANRALSELAAGSSRGARVLVVP